MLRHDDFVRAKTAPGTGLILQEGARRQPLEPAIRAELPPGAAIRIQATLRFPARRPLHPAARCAAADVLKTGLHSAWQAPAAVKGRTGPGIRS